MIEAYQTPGGHLLVVDDAYLDGWVSCDPWHVVEVRP